MKVLLKQMLLSITAAALFMPLTYAQKTKAEPSQAKPKATEEITLKSEIPGIDGRNVVASNNNVVVSIPKQPLRDWVVMVYVNFKDISDAQGIKKIKDLEKVGSTDQVAFITEIGRTGISAANSYDSDKISYWEGTRRYFMHKDTSAQTGVIDLTSPLVFQRKNTNMGTAKSVVNFVSWTKSQFPAKNYMLIMATKGMGHADEIILLPSADEAPTKGISTDGESYIRTAELTSMLKQMGGADVFVTDANSMQMIEVMFQIMNNTKVIVGSEDAHAGYMYAKVAKQLTDNPKADAIEAAKMLVNSAYAGDPTVYSAIDSSKLPAVYKAINNWTKAVMSAANIKEALEKAKNETVRYTDPMGVEELSTYTDLAVFVELVAKNTKNEKVHTASKELLNAIDEAVISVKTAGIKGKGIAISVPHKELQFSEDQLVGQFYESSYSELPFAKRTGWGSFFKWMTELLAAEEE